MNRVVSGGIELGWDISQIVDEVIERAAQEASKNKMEEFSDLVLTVDDSERIKAEILLALGDVYTLFSKVGSTEESSLFTEKASESSLADIGFVVLTKGSSKLLDLSRISVIDDKCSEYLIKYGLHHWAVTRGVDGVSDRLSLELDVALKEVEALIFISKTATFSKSYVVVY